MMRGKGFVGPCLVGSLGKLASVLICGAALVAAAGADTAETGDGNDARQSTITGSISGSGTGRKVGGIASTGDRGLGGTAGALSGSGVTARIGLSAQSGLRGWF